MHHFETLFNVICSCNQLCIGIVARLSFPFLMKRMRITFEAVKNQAVSSTIFEVLVWHIFSGKFFNIFLWRLTYLLERLFTEGLALDFEAELSQHEAECSFVPTNFEEISPRLFDMHLEDR